MRKMLLIIGKLTCFSQIYSSKMINTSKQFNKLKRKKQKKTVFFLISDMIKMSLTLTHLRHYLVLSYSPEIRQNFLKPNGKGS